MENDIIPQSPKEGRGAEGSYHLLRNRHITGWQNNYKHENLSINLLQLTPVTDCLIVEMQQKGTIWKGESDVHDDDDVIPSL